MDFHALSCVLSLDNIRAVYIYRVRQTWPMLSGEPPCGHPVGCTFVQRPNFKFYIWDRYGLYSQTANLQWCEMLVSSSSMILPWGHCHVESSPLRKEMMSQAGISWNPKNPRTGGPRKNGLKDELSTCLQIVFGGSENIVILLLFLGQDF